MKTHILAILLTTATFATAGEWKQTADMDAFHFEAGDLQGVFVADDRRELQKGFALHGIRSLSYKGHDLNAPDNEVGAKRRHQGHLNLYRVYGAKETFGSLRDENAQVEQHEDGATLTWEATDERPVKVIATWKITPPAQVDVTIEATPTRDIKNFELLPATYLPVHMLKGTYLDKDGEPTLTTFRPEAGRHEAYEFFPLGEKYRDVGQNTGRIHSSWVWPTTPRDELAALPIVFGGNDDLQIIQLANPEETSAVCVTPTPASGDPHDWTNIEKHSAIYFSLFGRDVKANEKLTVQIRYHVIDTPEDSAKTHLKLYEEFLNDLP